MRSPGGKKSVSGTTMDRPALQRLVGVPRSYTRASLIAARVIDDTDPEHDAVIDTVRGRQCAVLNFPAQNSSFLRGGSYSAVITRMGGACIPPAVIFEPEGGLLPR